MAVSNATRNRAATVQTNSPRHTTSLGQLDRRMAALALIGAPLLLALATFFWQDGVVGPTSAIFQVYSFALWAVAFMVLWSLVRSTFPRGARWGVWLGLLVSVAGAGWAYDGLYTSAYLMTGVGEETVAAANSGVFVAQLLTLYLPGLFFPLTLAVTGLALWRANLLPAVLPWLLVVGALGFPAGRIPRIQLLAHAADLLLLAALALIAWAILRGRVAYPPTEPKSA